MELYSLYGTNGMNGTRVWSYKKKWKDWQKLSKMDFLKGRIVLK